MATIREWHVDPVAFERDYLKPIHRVGTITSTLIFLALFLPSIWLYFITGVFPDWQTILTGFGLAMTYAIPFYISEPIAYYPIVGNAGWYLCGTIGNGSNLRPMRRSCAGGGRSKRRNHGGRVSCSCRRDGFCLRQRAGHIFRSAPHKPDSAVLPRLAPGRLQSLPVASRIRLCVGTVHTARLEIRSLCLRFGLGAHTLQSALRMGFGHMRFGDDGRRLGHAPLPQDRGVVLLCLSERLLPLALP